MSELGRWLVAIGTLTVLVGLALWFLPSAFSWFGRLPGDIRIEQDGVRVYVPLVSMLLVSLGLTLVLNLALWLIAALSR